MPLKNIVKESEYFVEEKLSLDNYIELVKKEPKKYIRTASMYLKDVFDYYGQTNDGKFKLFLEKDPEAKPVYGHRNIQRLIYKTLLNFIEEGSNNKLILLVGPNGSAKTSLIKKIMKATENYSLVDEGALHSFSWIFPKNKSSKNKIGFTKKESLSENYANLSEEEVNSIIPSELRDHPLLLLPLKARRKFIAELFKYDLNYLENIKKTYLFNGDLSKRNRQIYEALLKEYEGNYQEVFKHIRIERYTVSRRYSAGAVSIEPQMHVDATLRPINYDNRMLNLPPSILSLNLFNMGGELVYANRGILEYSDLLKRPLDTFKYLLMTLESKTLNIQGVLTELDVIFTGTSNEIHLDAFKQHPDYRSYKERFNVIHVPYLTNYQDEEKIYKDQIDSMESKKKFEPHTLECFALWNVLIRLKKAEQSHYHKEVQNIIGRLSLLDKALLYANENAQLPKFTLEEQKKIKKYLKEIKMEFFGDHYEGKFGISPRVSKDLLHEMAHKNKDSNLSYINILDYLSTIDFSQFGYRNDMRGYNVEIIGNLSEHYANLFDEEARTSLDLVDNRSYEDYIKKYILEINSLIKGEKIKNNVTGNYELPNMEFIMEVESSLKITEKADDFRKNLITEIAAFRLDNPDKEIVYTDIFQNNIYKKLKLSFEEKQRLVLKDLAENMNLFMAKSLNDKDKVKTIELLLKNLTKKFKYSEKVAIDLLMKNYKDF